MGIGRSLWGDRCVWQGRFHRLRRALAVVFILGMVSGEALAIEGLNVSGQFGLDAVAIPIPVTLVSEIQLDTPGKLTVFKFGVESLLDLTVEYGQASAHLNGLASVAGLERCILEGSFAFSDVRFEPELWFAAPFETVMDINHFTNWVAIPPGGDLMLVTARCTLSASVGGIDVENLFMLQDVTFPDPGRDFGPLQYPVQSQSFHAGSILTLSAPVSPSVTLRSVTCFSATPSSTRVIGWSARGSVDRESSLCDTFAFTEKLTLSGLEYCGVSAWVSLDVEPCQTEPLTLSGGGSVSGLMDLDLSGSFSLFPLSISGFSLSTTLCDIIMANIQLSDHLKFESASLRAQAELDTGIMQGSAYSGCNFGSTSGLTALTFGSSLTHGSIAGGLAFSMTKQEGSLRLTSISPKVSIRLTPATFTLSARYGRSGLVQALLSLRLVF